MMNPIRWLRGWLETRAILKDPEMMEAIRRGREDVAYGRVHPFSDLEKEYGLDKEKAD